MTVNLKLSKSQFALIIVVVNAGLQLFNGLVVQALPAGIREPIQVFVIAVGNGAVVYLTTEQAVATPT